MEDNARDDQKIGKNPTQDQVTDQEGANPAHPLPANADTDNPARKAEMDAQIEDRFEASDN